MRKIKILINSLLLFHEYHIILRPSKIFGCEEQGEDPEVGGERRIHQ